MSKQQDSGAALALAKEIEHWDYDKSIEKMRPLVKQWKKATTEMARELYLAKEFLTTQKGQYKDPEADDYLLYSWSSYCEEIGMSYQTANNWLKSFTPKELSDTGKDVYLLAPSMKTETAADRVIMQGRINEVLRTGERPADWADEEDKELKRQVKAAELARITEQAEKYIALVAAKTRDYFTETMHRSKDIANFKLDSRDQYAAQMAIFKQIAAYLETFDDTETRARAAFNIAFKTKNIANEIAHLNFQLNELDKDGERNGS